MANECGISRQWWIIHRDGGYDLAFLAPQTTLESLNAYSQTHVQAVTPRTLAADEAFRLLESVVKEFRDKECGCDGEYEDGRLKGYTCYFHRIEPDITALLAKMKAREGIEVL